MLGTPIQFSHEQFALHERMCTLVYQHFGHWIIDPTTTQVHKILGPGHSIAEVLSNLNANLYEALKYSRTETEGVAKYSLVAAKMKQLMLNEPPATPNMTLYDAKREFYKTLHIKLYYCNTLNNYIFKELHQRVSEGQAIHEPHFHQATGYLLLLSCVLSFNMLVYQTHPIYQTASEKRLEELDQKNDPSELFNESYQLSQNTHCERIVLLQDALSNWVTLLECFHLDHNQEPEYEQLRKLFIKRYIDFTKKLKNDPAFIDALPTHMRSEFSLQELTYHTQQMQARAIERGFAFNPHILQASPERLYLASPSAINALMNVIKKCTRGVQCGKRAQIFFYYNEPNGNIDIFDVCYDRDKNQIEIVNVHSGNSPVQYHLLKKLSALLHNSKLDFKLYACQADFGELQQAPALYALRLSLLLAKKNVASLAAYKTSMPTFQDSTLKDTLMLEESLPDVTWFSIRALGHKAILLYSSLEKIRGLLPKIFEKYQEQYGLSAAAADDPDTLYTYADDYRKRLAYDFQLHSPFKGLSLDSIKKKLHAENDGQVVRRAAAGHSTMREFTFLMAHFKAQANQTSLHLPARMGEYTPLQWALREQKATRAALLLNATPFTSEELAEKSKEGKSAYDYFAEATADSSIKQNAVLARCLKR